MGILRLEKRGAPLMKGGYVLVLVIACLCFEPVVAHPRVSSEARGLEERLSNIGKHAKKLNADLAHKHSEHKRAAHKHGKHRLLEEANAVSDLAKATEAEKDSGADSDDIFGATKEEEEAAAAKEKRNMGLFLVACIVTIIILGLIAYYINVSKVEYTNTHQNTTDTVDMASFFGFTTVKPINVFVGMASGLVFGIIDNAGLFFGMEYLDPLFSKLPNGDEEKVVSGYGNTFSDCIGAFLGTFAGSIVKDLAVKHGGYLESEEYPIWSEAVGITVGCIIGVLVPRAILGDPKVTRLNRAKAEALASGVTQAQIDEVMREFDRLDKETDKERPGQVKVEDLKKATPGSIDKFIAEADAAGNGDGWVTRDELYDLLKKANLRYQKASSEIINKADKTTDDQGNAKSL